LLLAGALVLLRAARPQVGRPQRTPLEVLGVRDAAATGRGAGGSSLQPLMHSLAYHEELFQSDQQTAVHNLAGAKSTHGSSSAHPLVDDCEV